MRQQRGFYQEYPFLANDTFIFWDFIPWFVILNVKREAGKHTPTYQNTSCVKAGYHNKKGACYLVFSE